MSEHNYIYRDRFRSWDEEVRDAWAKWFADNGLSLDDIASFHVDDKEVAATVYLADENGKRFAVRDALGNLEAANERVTVKHRGTHPPIPDATGTRI